MKKVYAVNKNSGNWTEFVRAFFDESQAREYAENSSNNKYQYTVEEVKL